MREFLKKLLIFLLKNILILSFLLIPSDRVEPEREEIRKNVVPLDFKIIFEKEFNHLKYFYNKEVKDYLTNVPYSFYTTKGYSALLDEYKSNITIINDKGEIELYLKKFTMEKEKESENYTIKSFPFDRIGTFAISRTGEIYIENIHEKVTIDEDPSKSNYETISHSIHKFDKHGNHLYKLGKDGKYGVSFSSNEFFKDFYIDLEGNFYVTLFGFEEQTNQTRNEGYLKLLRYSKEGNLEFEINLSNISFKDKEDEPFIYDVQKICLTPDGNRILCLVSYFLRERLIYPNDHLLAGKEYYRDNFMYNKLIYFSIPDNQIKETVYKTEDETYSIFGITKEGEIVLYKIISSHLFFKIIDPNGNDNNQIKGIKNIYLNNYMTNFFFQPNGDVLNIFNIEDKIHKHKYRLVK